MRALHAEECRCQLAGQNLMLVDLRNNYIIAFHREPPPLRSRASRPCCIFIVRIGSERLGITASYMACHVHAPTRPQQANNSASSTEQIKNHPEQGAKKSLSWRGASLRMCPPRYTITPTRPPPVVMTLASGIMRAVVVVRG